MYIKLIYPDVFHGIPTGSSLIMKGNNMSSEKERNTKQSNDKEERFIESGWSRSGSIRRSLSKSPQQHEKEEAEQKIYSEPDNPSPRQETGGPNKPTA
jgi:hypothetical protein